MLPYVVAAIAGAMWVQRSKPAVRHEKKTALGPRSGITYKVDDFKTAGLVLVTANDGTSASFARAQAPRKGFVFVRGSGNPRVLELMKQDFTSADEVSG